MRFVDISVERFGVLQNTLLRDLPPGVTVVYGNNGSGKTTAVSFLRGLLFGYTTAHTGYQPDDARSGGSLTLESHGRSRRIARERSRGIASDLSMMDLATGVSVPATQAELSQWINETVYREIFSVGDQEAARFDLLTRLCLDDSGQPGAEEEIHRAQSAIEQSVRDREGNGRENGLRQEMTHLRQQRDRLTHELAEIRRTSPELPARIAETEAELRRLRTALAPLDQQITEVQAEIRRLEERLEVLRRRNVVSLDRRAIENQISELMARQQRWVAIQRSIQQEISVLAKPAASRLKGNDSLKSIRALVSRLEQRMETADGMTTGIRSPLSGGDREVVGEHIRGEVFSLCDYVKKHESAIAAQEASLEVLLGQRTLQDIENVDAVLQGQIDGLREELSRSEDVLPASLDHSVECQSHAHAEFRRTCTNVPTTRGNIAEVEAELARMRRRLEELTTERREVQDRLQRLEHELVELRSRMKPVGSLSDIDRLKTAIANVDAQLKALQNRWNALERTEANLRIVIERLEQYRTPGVLDLASEYISRLTDDECFQLSADDAGSQIIATTRQAGRPQTIQQLSRGTRDQVALALRLALIQHRAEDAERCPLILDDVFITADDDRAEAVADLLMDVADDGQQIIFFTCQNEILNLFKCRNAGIRYLEPQQPIASAFQPEPDVMPVDMPRPLLSIPVAPPKIAPMYPSPPVPVQRPQENPNWLFYLEVDNSVEDLSGLTVAEVEAFRASGIETIDELLSLSADDLEARFRQHGYSINRDRIRAWRGQAELATQVPMLRRSDAELLYAAGIQNTVELSRMRPESVYNAVVAFQDTPVGSRYRRSGRTVDRQQAINWSRWSQHARTLTEARKSRSRYFVRTSDRHNSPAHAAQLARSGETDGVNYRRARIAQSGTTRRRQPRPRLSASSRRTRDERISRRRERVAQHSSSYRTSERQESESTDSVRELRFYLNRSDDVEAAPSIGPKTAQHLGAVGIYTVDDLLNAKALEVSTRLNKRRITTEIIEQWQAQARLVCQIPELRGHDSQILVACGIMEPEQLAAKRPVDLMAVVGPFADTSEGERIVRGGRKPDLEEVTDWIRWAQSLRSLTSAA